MTYEEAHHGDTHKEGLHGFTSLGEIVVLDGSSDQLRLGIGVLSISDSHASQKQLLTTAEGGLTYFKTDKSFLLRIWLSAGPRLQGKISLPSR